MPANKYALIRYRVIDRCIRNKYKPYPSVEELIDACSEALGKSVSKSTIEKDISAMKNDLGLGYEAPIVFNKEKGGYLYDDPDYSIEDIPLSSEEIESIQLAANTLYQFKDHGLFKQYNAAIEKILNKVKLSPNESDDQETMIQFEQQSTVRGQEFLAQIYECTLQHHTITFRYESYQKGEFTERKLDPYLLKEYGNRWYVVGWDHNREGFRVFGLDRIHEVTDTKEHFTRKKKFKPANYFKHSVGITAPPAEEPVLVELRCNEVLLKYLESQPLHQSQRLKGEIVTLKVLITYELIEKLLGFGSQLEVVSPPDLRTKIADAHQDALAKYA